MFAGVECELGDATHDDPVWGRQECHLPGSTKTIDIFLLLLFRKPFLYLIVSPLPSACPRTARWSTSSSGATSSSRWGARKATSSSTRSSSTSWPGAGLDRRFIDQLDLGLVSSRLDYCWPTWSALSFGQLDKLTKDWAWLTWPTLSTWPTWSSNWSCAVTVTFSAKVVKKNPLAQKTGLEASV